MQGQSPSTDSYTQSTNREWTCQRWFHNIADKVSAKTHRYVGRFVAVASVPFTFIPSLACDLYQGTKNLYQRTVSEAPVQGQHRIHPGDDILIQKLEEENLRLENSLRRYESLINGLEDRVTLLKRNKSALEERCRHTKSANSELKKQVDEEIASNQQLTSKVQALNETVERLNREVDNLTRENLESDYLISDLTNELHSLQGSSSGESDNPYLSFMEDDNGSISSNELDEPANTSNSGIEDGNTDSFNVSFKSVSSSDPNAP